MVRGTLIKESLSDESILDLITIEKAEIWKAENHTVNQPKYWTAIFFVSHSEEFADRLSKSLKNEWYVDLNTNQRKMIVLKNQVVQYDFGDRKGKQQAIDYCRKVGIPESQIDWGE